MALTPNDAYKKELRRIKQFIRRATKRGFEFPENVIPKKPKKITEASIRRLKDITPKSLYKKASYTDPQTGEKMSGLSGRKRERSRASKKGAETRKNNPPTSRKGPEHAYNTLYKVREEIRKWSPLENWSNWFSEVKRGDKNILESILDGAITSDGERTVAMRLDANSETVLSIVNEVLYSSGGGQTPAQSREQINFDIALFSSIITGRKSTLEERMDLEYAMEENEEY